MKSEKREAIHLSHHPELVSGSFQYRLLVRCRNKFGMTQGEKVN